MSARPLDTREIWEKAKRTPLSRDEVTLAALEEEGLVTAGGPVERPDCIIGGHWPCKTHGARRVACADCGKHLALSPDSGGAMAALWPDVPVVCIDCVRTRSKAAQ